MSQQERAEALVGRLRAAAVNVTESPDFSPGYGRALQEDVELVARMLRVEGRADSGEGS